MGLGEPANLSRDNEVYNKQNSKEMVLNAALLCS